VTGPTPSRRRRAPLTNMWRVDVRTLSAAERALWDAFRHEGTVDLSRKLRVGARTIRAEVLAALLLGAQPAEAGRIAAVRLTGTRITGALDLAHGVIAVPVRLQRCELDGVLDLTGVKARGIDHVDGYLPRNYETLAAMYRNSGDDRGARRVLLARERERRAHLPWYGKAWSLAAGGHRRVRVPAGPGGRVAAGVPCRRHPGLRPAPPAAAGRGSASRLQPVHLRA